MISLAVSEAVHAAVREVLSSPELLRAALEKYDPMPASEPKPPTLKENVVRITNKMCEKAKQMVSLASKKLTEVCASVTKVATHVPALIKAVAKAAWSRRKSCAVAVGVGVLFGAMCYLGGQVFSSVANGLGAAALTLPVRHLFLGGDR